jgi:ribulose-phosphate 3-epimerase
MVQKPEEWIAQVKGPHMHMVHVEALGSWKKVVAAVKKSGGKLGVSLSPETPFEKIKPYLDQVEKVLVMSVHPGFYGQNYIPKVELKIRGLRKIIPKTDIEVDGGINSETGVRAAAAGANNLAAATAIFTKPDIGKAVEELKIALKKGWEHGKQG